ncbi:prolyl oligopeptidase family serine peptidase [Pseudoxanthomonas broegbernensis]|nr:prolyl oligopeptidase family serine peptidase [Pseudoxanthomonas broegbernensis]MBB6063513.1 oligopeptidase B [Pseudoxanthomonas broegbernensis]
MAGRRTFLAACAGLLAGAVSPRIAAAAASISAPSPWPLPPAARRIAATIGRFGHARIDPYAWLRPKDWFAVLRDPSTLEAPIRAQIDAENAYAQAMLAPTRPLQRQLRERIERLAALPRPLAGLRSGGFLYATRTAGGNTVHVRTPSAGGPEQVLLDEAADTGGKAPAATRHSADGRLFGWAVETGEGRHRLRVRTVADGRLRVDDIDDGTGAFAFSPDGRWLFWAAHGADGQGASVLRRDLASGAQDVLYAEADAAFALTLRTTAAGGYLVVRADDGQASEVRLLALRAPGAALRRVEPRTPGLRYDVDEWNGGLLVLTNADGAHDFKLMAAPLERPGRAAWTPLVAHVPGRPIHAVHPFAAALVREEWRDALPRLVLMHADGREREVAFDAPAWALQVAPGQDWDVDALAFALQSPRMPPQSRLLDLVSGRHAADAAQPAAASSPAFDPERYEVRRFDVRADDGAQVPVTVVMRAGQALDGNAPLLLRGYGAYGHSAEAAFEPPVLALVDQGWVHAVAHVRGGAERGSRWWDAVRRTGKKKTFTDFIACAEHLADAGYTARGRIVGFGLSAGGTLVGAAYTMRPELWAGMIAPVAFVDVLTSLEYYEDHPIGARGIPVWGDPADPAEHAYVASYSPYDNLRAAAYPALLATGVVDDDAVSFWEPLKFAIKARVLTTAGQPILSLTAAEGGHLGPLGAYPGVEQQAMYLAFAIWAAERRWGEVPQRAHGTAR